MAPNSGFTGDIVTAPILERLVEVLLVEAFRFRSASAARETQGLLAGLSDLGAGPYTSDQKWKLTPRKGPYISMSASNVPARWSFSRSMFRYRKPATTEARG